MNRKIRTWVIEGVLIGITIGLAIKLHHITSLLKQILDKLP